MPGAVQRIVDRIADELHRPALLEDPCERLIAYSTHLEPIDEARSHTILHRRAAPEVVAWLKRRGLPAARSPLRVPGNPDLGMLPRICFPIRDHRRLLGYLWFVEGGDRFSAQDTLRATHAADELRRELYEETAPSAPTPPQVVSALQHLLVDGRETGAASRTLLDEGCLETTDHIVVVVIEPLCANGTDVAAIEAAVSCALYAVWQSVPPSKALQLRQPDHGVLLLRVPDNGEHILQSRLAAISDAVRAAHSRVPGIARMLAGAGGRRLSLVEAADSYREARLAARAGLVLPRPDSVVRWTELGFYQVVAELVGDPPRVIHPGLRALIGDPEALPLLETLETYLDLAGNAQLAAQQLNLHRGSLYYRLQRVEQLAGTSLRDGMQRLALHLELKTARFTGDYAPRQTLPTASGGSGPRANLRHQKIARTVLPG